MKRLIRTTIVVRGKIPQGNWQNKSKTKDLKCSRCESWIRHWENCSGNDRPKVCSIKGCTNPVTDGSHVINPEVRGVWIAPTCHQCNTDFEAVFELNKNVLLVNANTEYSCKIQ